MTPSSPTPRLWEWPTVLSLDAPLIAVLWQSLLAAGLGVRLELHHHLLLAASVWLVYVADRWLDAFRLNLHVPGTTRHRAHLAWRRPLLGVWLLVLAASSVLAGTSLTLAELEVGFALLAAALAYLALVHLPPRAVAPPKELLVALLFAAGVGLFLIPGAGPLRLALPLALFAGLCFLNTGLIALWERRVDRAQAQASPIGLHPALERRLGALCWLLMLLPLALWPLQPALRGVWLSLSASALALLVLKQHAAAFESELLRVLADLALLSPALALVGGRLGL